jgi:hypothetical protein
MLLVAGAAVPAVTIIVGIVLVAPVPAVLPAGCVAPPGVVLVALEPAVVAPERPGMPLVAAVVPAELAAAVVAPVAVMPGCIVPAPSVAGAGALEQAAITLVMHKAYSRLDMALSPTRFLLSLDNAHTPILTGHAGPASRRKSESPAVNRVTRQ